MSAAQETVSLNIRPMRRADVVQIDRIENETYPFPWSLRIFRDCLQAGYLCRVLDSADGIVGYAVVSVAAAEAHILNFCIRPDRRKQRLGSFFLQRLVEEIDALEANRIILEVRPSNVAAKNLYKQAGFTLLGVRRGYYPAQTGREDALVLTRDLAQAQPDPDSGSI